MRDSGDGGRRDVVVVVAVVALPTRREGKKITVPRTANHYAAVVGSFTRRTVCCTGASPPLRVRGG